MSQETKESDVTCVISTDHGRLTRGDAVDFLRTLPDASVRLIVSSVWFTGPYDITSDDPTCRPFSEWFRRFMKEFERVLLPDGSVVLEMGCTWASDGPVRTIQNYAALADLLEEGEWHLLQEFYWYNPQLLYAREEWVDEQRIRMHDSVSTWYWFSRAKDVPVDTTKVRMFQSSLTHPFGNLLTMGDSYTDLQYLDHCAAEGTEPHIDRYPVALPTYFMELLTREGEHVVDPFVGIGSTAVAAELSGRRWSCNDLSGDVIEVAKERIRALGSPDRNILPGV
ncbi:site-specific DNA-methyltransferase [Streptomyces sp. NBC_01298]|uniref:DNA-methyltransferase n=1 Tax=Streptomyces sp. NBC_01298 TaxID=2903817 RepID=UPI002E13FB90|nr:site-specific DNA-methyltransferase [Streptomyces sp. NBC_01298]